MDIYCFYMMNGLTIFAKHDGEQTETDYVIERAVMVKINPNNSKEIGMQVAFPFSDQTAQLLLNKGTVTAHSNLAWNQGLCAQFANAWLAVAKRAEQEASGIEVVPANAIIPGMQKPGLGVGRPQGNRPPPPLRSV